MRRSDWCSVCVRQAPGQQSLEVINGLRGGEFPEEADEVGVRIDAVGLAGFDDRVEIRAGVCTGDRIGEQPVAAADDQFALILPISGKKLKSIIDGIRCMVVASRFVTLSNAAAVT